MLRPYYFYNQASLISTEAPTGKVSHLGQLLVLYQIADSR